MRDVTLKQTSGWVGGCGWGGGGGGGGKSSDLRDGDNQRIFMGTK